MRYKLSDINGKPATLLRKILLERRTSCTNYYSPLYEKLTELADKLDNPAVADTINHALATTNGD
jgi:hypothetical protein